jgi:transposase
VTLTPGQQHESTVAEELVARASAKACIADAGYDADRIIAAIRARGMRAVIAPGSGRRDKRRCNRRLYAIRYRVECFFHRLKRCRRIATRYEKTARNYLALLHVACALMWLA